MNTIDSLLDMFLTEGTEQINLYLSDNGYFNDIDTDSIFYCGIKKESFSYGEIAVEISNIDVVQILNLFSRYKIVYTAPTLDFVKEFYNDLRSMNLSDLVSRGFITSVLQFYDNSPDWNYIKDLLIFLKFDNPSFFSSTQNRFTYEVHTYVNFFEDSNGILQMFYTNLDLFDLQALDILYARKYNVSILKCSYCHKSYVKINGNNIKYCPNCRHTHADKITTDEFKKLYRTKYKTMHQRMKRSQNPFEYYKLYMEPWTIKVKKKMEEYRMRNDLNGFKNFIEKSMIQYKSKGE